MSYFPDISNVQFEGGQSSNPFAFKYYNPEQTIGNQKMKDWLRFSVAYWHTFTLDGADPFGAPTMQRPWDHYTGMDLAKARADAAFEFIDKIGAEYFCFHDVDVAPEGNSLKESQQNLDAIVPILKEHMKSSGTKLLWNTANMFVHPRFMHGAATSNDPDVYAYSAAKVKKQLEIAKELGAENYVFWGGREGYESLLNTDMGFELDNLANFYHMALDYAKEIGFNGQFLIEPKPKEPTKHQYDYDTASAYAFLQKYGLQNDFKINIEANHATLAGHSFEHELHYARVNGILGSVDANQGDLLLGWDTDEFPTDIYAATLAMYEILKNGGLGSGGLNFDAKVRRTSFEPNDLFHGHVVGMDTFALGLKIAHKMLEDNALENIISERYQGFQTDIGQKIVQGTTSFHELEKHAHQAKIKNVSGHNEMIRGMINQYIRETD
ncbi:xylose isomerase [Salisediminibacterium halotolerans]|uniref:Xylose isomerase n=1 Tax=Salisediminibacterium halotolerans TaxID=517425 RepID=A0A1H9WJS8_9BACI|nr:xylose isomerase [Salisediminibacterium haloalkalitolerans]SES34081.1 xylose isomerase [Salisediminibacterium haloalkalitolerans]